jgi:hypothetical protein
VEGERDHHQAKKTMVIQNHRAIVSLSIAGIGILGCGSLPMFINTGRFYENTTRSKTTPQFVFPEWKQFGI